MNIDFVKAGAPSLGTDPHDDHVWYFNGTSTAQVIVALDYILPTFGDFHSPDLVLSGPNFGWTVGPFFYTVSGTVGAAITAIERGIPAIAFSSGNNIPIPYTWVNATTKVGLRDPATITARLAATLVETLVQKANGGPVMPGGYGMTVNFPFITSLTNASCLNPAYVLTRMSPALPGKAIFNHKTGLFGLREEESAQHRLAAAFSRLHGAPENKNVLPVEHDVISSHCTSSMTVFTLQLDGTGRGECLEVPDLADLVPFVSCDNKTLPPIDPSFPAGNATIIVVVNGSSSQTPTPTRPLVPPPTIKGLGSKMQFSLSAFVLVLFVAGFVL